MAAPINSLSSDLVKLDEPTEILTSFHYFKNTDIAQIHSWGTRIIGDSGAFSALTQGTTIDRDEFHAWAHRWKDDFFWTASLDVIGDADATFENWKAAKREGLHLVPTLHHGASPRELDKYVDEGADFFGLGGLVGSSAQKQLRWMIPVFQYVQKVHPQVRFHGWGLSHAMILDRLPFWSADSSGFASAFRFATLKLFNPLRGRFISVNLDGRDLYQHRDILRRHYGIGWKDAAESTPQTRRNLGRVAIKSMQLYAAWLRTRQQVTPPASLMNRINCPGTRVVGAMGAPFSAQGQSITPDGNPIPRTLETVSGPRSFSALGAPGMQPSKSINPQDVEPSKLSSRGQEQGTRFHSVTLAGELQSTVSPQNKKFPKVPKDS